VRLSIGCEHVEDLWTDLAATLDATAAVATTPDVTAHQPARQDSTAWSHP
jgi:hypothetical protein